MHGCSFVASLPDICELQGMKPPEYKVWFTRAAELVMLSCPDDGVAIFYQSDIKLPDGTWLDKSYLCNKAAEQCGFEMLWHKLVCRQPPGTKTWGRPSYTHMLCYSKGVRLVNRARTAFADVIPEAGQFMWPKAMGLIPCQEACKFIKQFAPGSHTIVDPFCGEGTVLAVANSIGMDAIGVDLSMRRARISMRVVLDPAAGRMGLRHDTGQFTLGTPSVLNDVSSASVVPFAAQAEPPDERDEPEPEAAVCHAAAE